MYCKFCGFENEDGSIYCSACGKRIDGKIECPKCHQLTNPGNFCTICGSPLDGRIRCPKCGEVYEGNFCSKCGAPAPGMEKRKEIFASTLTDRGLDRDMQDALEAVEPVIGETAADDAPGDGERKGSGTRKNLALFSSVLGILAILAVLVFTFFTGMTVRGSAYGIDVTTSETGYGKMNLYHFFYRAFANIRDYGPYLTEAETSACNAVAVFGLLISVGMIVTMVGMACRCAVKLYRSAKSGTSLDMRRDVALTYMLYVAFCLMFRALMYEYENYYGVVAELDLNGATIAGLATGGALAAASFVVDLVRQSMYDPQDRRTGKVVAAVICTAILLFSAWFMTGKAAGFSNYSYAAEEAMEEYTFGFLKHSVYFGGSGLTCAVFAQLFMTATLLIIGLSCARLLSSAVDPGYAFSKPTTELLLFVCATTAFVTGICTAVNSMNYYLDHVLTAMVRLGGSDIAFFITGYVLCLVGIIVSLAAGRSYNKKLKETPVPTPDVVDEGRPSGED